MVYPQRQQINLFPSGKDLAIETDLTAEVLVLCDFVRWQQRLP